MSPTSYQTAPPRESMITTTFQGVKRDGGGPGVKPKSAADAKARSMVSAARGCALWRGTITPRQLFKTSKAALNSRDFGTPTIFRNSRGVSEFWIRRVVVPFIQRAPLPVFAATVVSTQIVTLLIWGVRRRLRSLKDQWPESPAVLLKSCRLFRSGN